MLTISVFGVALVSAYGFSAHFLFMFMVTSQSMSPLVSKIGQLILSIVSAITQQF